MEAEETERIYFEMVKKYCSKTHIEIHTSNNKTSAKQVLRKAKKFIAQNPNISDEIWLVIDVDENLKKDLEELMAWSKQKSNYGLALSNPKFEYWLLLHFEEGNAIKSLSILDSRLKRHLPNYTKNCLDKQKLKNRMYDAIKNAKIKYKQVINWFCDNHTTIFQLMEKILAEEDKDTFSN